MLAGPAFRVHSLSISLSPDVAGSAGVNQSMGCVVNQMQHVLGLPATDTEWQCLTKAVATGAVPAVVLRSKRAEIRTLRWISADGQSVIVKLNGQKGWRTVLKTMLGRTGGMREAFALRRLRAAGIPCPRVLAYHKSIRGLPEALYIEDMGPVRRAIDVFRELVVAGQSEVIETMESGIIEMTQRVVAAGFVDEDHSLMNIVVRPDRSLLRLDLECARTFRQGNHWMLVPMLSRLFRTYAIACGNEAGRAEDFVKRTAAALSLPSAVTSEVWATVAADLVESRFETLENTHG